MKYVKLNVFLNKSSFNNINKNELNINFDNNINICKINIEKNVKNETEENVRKNNCFKCFWPKCQFKTEFYQNYKNHKLIHLNIKQFKCDFNNCNKKFRRSDQLINHKYIHSNEKNIICDFNECKKTFKNKSHLIRHKRCVHLNERQFKYD